jgi:N6-adenosine-specific RNA methylase IME4
MPVEAIKALPVESIAGDQAHLWLWTTNQFLRAAFDVLDAWGFKYLATVTWVKPSGLGAWFANTTQHCLFGYYGKCHFPLARYKPTHFLATPRRHSAKPEEFYNLVRSISPGPRLDMFNRRVLEGFTGWGDESPDQMLRSGAFRIDFQSARRIPVMGLEARYDAVTWARYK